MAIGVCALKGQDHKARGALSTPGRRSQGGFCTPTGYDRQPRIRALSPSAGDRTSLLDHAAPHEACDRTPLGYKTLPGSFDPGCSAHPGFAILPFQGTNTDRLAVRSRWCATSEALPRWGPSKPPPICLFQGASPQSPVNLLPMGKRPKTRAERGFRVPRVCTQTRANSQWSGRHSRASSDLVFVSRVPVFRKSAVAGSSWPTRCAA